MTANVSSFFRFPKFALGCIMEEDNPNKRSYQKNLFKNLS
jgi:hypothetical protein